MATKLKSILKRIPWLLALKATALGLAWLSLPFWAFLAVAGALYLIPLFRPAALALPFFFVLAVGFLLPPSLGGAALIGVLGFLVFGIKDLVLVRRMAAYRFLIALLVLVILASFFVRRPMAPLAEVFAALGAGAAFYLLLRRFEAHAATEEAGLFAPSPLSFVGAGICALLGAEFLWTFSFLPFAALSATALAFVVFALLFDFFTGRIQGTLVRRDILLAGSLFLVAATFLLVSAPWEV
jgi:hypothetical protein